MNFFNFRNKDQSDNQPGYMSNGNEMNLQETDDSLSGKSSKRAIFLLFARRNSDADLSCLNDNVLNCLCLDDA